jgi:hypothetical protein
MILARALVEELRRRLIVLPSLAVLERICAEAATRAQRRIFALLTEDLSTEQVAEARGGFQSAHRNTGKLSEYLEALVRNLCS